MGGGDMSIDINTKHIASFLRKLNDTEYIYLQHCMGMRDNITRLIERHNLTKEDVCQLFEIKEKQYDAFVKGCVNYSVHDMARLNAAFMKLEAEKLEERVPVKVVTSNK